MDSSQKEFLLILAYLYVRYCKYDEALILYRGLYEFFEDDIEILLDLIFALYITGRFSEAIHYVEQLDGVEMLHDQEKLFFLLKSHVMWGLGHDRDSREALIHYLGLEERDMRTREASRMTN